VHVTAVKQPNLGIAHSVSLCSACHDSVYAQAYFSFTYWWRVLARRRWVDAIAERRPLRELELHKHCRGLSILERHEIDELERRALLLFWTRTPKC
jgi:hypothetical protein